jgi:SAM-dependent methyltransferase
MFLGGPVWDFERVGRMILEVLEREGLVPSSRLLDIGCGALRGGYWLMGFLEPGHYFGIEPNEAMLQVGLREIVGPELAARADAHFSSNDDFDFSVFGESFDFVVARSIWTHASKRQISAMLGSFAATGSPNAVFMASYCPAGLWFRAGHRYPRLHRLASALPLSAMSPVLARLPSPWRFRDLDEDVWIGRSHESNEAGGRRHSLAWISSEASRHGLKVQLTSHPVSNHQYWLRVTRA